MGGIDIAMAVLAVGFAIAFPLVLVRAIVGMNRSGDRGGGAVSSGLAAAMLELDKITRPSVQHVEQAEDHIADEDHHDGA